MAMELTDEVQLLEDNVRTFVTRDVAPLLEALNHYPDHPLPPGMLEGLRELGLLEWALPEEAGGDAIGDDLIAVVAGALAETVAAPAALLLAHILGQRLVVATGSTDSIARIAADPGGGAALLACPMYAEPSEAAGGLQFRLHEGELHLWGELEFVCNAPIASMLVLPVRSASGTDEMGLVVLEADTPGVHISEPLWTLGMRGAPVADVRLEDMRIEPRHLILQGGGEAVVRREQRRLWGAAAAIGAGVVAGAVRDGVDYARDRYQGGRQIIEHPEVRRMIADLMADRDLCREASRRLASVDVSEPEATGLFVRAKEAASRATIDGVQLLGGYGYMEDYGQERRMRDAKQAQCLLGRCDVLRQRSMDEVLSEAAE